VQEDTAARGQQHAAEPDASAAAASMSVQTTCYLFSVLFNAQDLTPGQPARPMLAAVASSVEYAHSKLHGHAAVVETKFDGERMQVCQWSRALGHVTLPDGACVRCGAPDLQSAAAMLGCCRDSQSTCCPWCSRVAQRTALTVSHLADVKAQRMCMAYNQMYELSHMALGARTPQMSQDQQRTYNCVALRRCTWWTTRRCTGSRARGTSTARSPATMCWMASCGGRPRSGTWCWTAS
jgi:hypothetical protein